MMSYPFVVKSTVEFLTEFPEEMTEGGTPEFGPWIFPRNPDFGKVKGVR